MALFTPTNQKRLTNVSVVKLLVKTEKKRHRFEIACYPNKVVAWRQKLESKINEVLQSELVFTNVSKAEIASKEILKEAFHTTNILDICKIILEKGELQLTEKERQIQLDNLIKDVAKLVAGKTLNPSTKVCFSPGVIEKMIKDCHINLRPNKSAKQQSLDVIRLLKRKSDVPIDMALFSVTVLIPQKQIKAVKRELLNFCENIVNEVQQDHDLKIEAVFEPGNFDLFKENFGSKCTVDLTEIVNVIGDKGAGIDSISTKIDSDDEKELDESAHSKNATQINKRVEYDSDKDKGVIDDEDQMSSKSNRKNKKNKDYSSSVKDDSEEEKIEGKEKVMTKKSRRRAKNKTTATGGDDNLNDTAETIRNTETVSSDDEDDGKTRRRGKKRGTRK